MSSWRWRVLVSLSIGAACVSPASPAGSPARSFLTPQQTVDLATSGRAALEAEASLLAVRWAPIFAQQTSRELPERDRPLPIDFDGDWDAMNNWSNLTPEAGHRAPAVYFSAILTETHAYLTYTLFYPRDWIPFVCLPYVCHDNDLEVALVVVERGQAAADGLVLVETKAHRDYLAVSGANVARGSRGQPVISVESQGHGMRAVRLDSPTSEGDTLLLAERSSTAPGGPRTERYDLLPLRETLWARRNAGAAGGRLWSEGESGWLAYTGTRLGQLGHPLGASMAVSEYRGGVRPPWGLAASGARGDWFLDPALEATTRYGAWFAAHPTSRSYVLNPYVEDLASECSGARCSRPPPEAIARASLSGGGILTALGFLLLRLAPRLREVARPGPRRRRTR